MLETAIVLDMAIIVAITVGLTQVLKLTKVKKRYIPISALVIATLLTGLSVGWSTSIIIPGLIAGLTSMGLWSGTKTTVQG